MQEVRAVWRFTLSLARTLGWRFGLVLLVGLAASVTAGVGLVVMVPLLSLVGVDAGGGTTQALVARVAAALGGLGLQLSAPVLLGLNAAVLIATAAVSRYQSVLESRALEGFVLARRDRLFEAITRANWRHLVGGRASNSVHLLTNETDRFASAGAAVIGLITQGFLAVAHLAVAVAIAPALTALVMVAGLTLAGATAPLTWRAKARGREVSRAYKGLFGEIADHLGGLKTVKAYGLEDATTARFRARSRETAEALVGVTRNHANVGFLLQAGSAVLLSAIVLVALGMPQVTPAGLLMLLYLFARLVPMLSGLQRSFQSALARLPSIERVEAATGEFEAEREHAAASSEPMRCRRAVELRGVSFAYETEDGRRVLHGVDMVVPAGRTTALVGPSGGGKSTVADLLIGLLEPDAGALLVDGEEVSGARRSAWRRHIAYVAQDVFLFHDTVRANLLVGDPGATEERLWEVLDQAAAGFVRDLPQGLDTVVGDRGSTLSGGERQRLALARALLREPELLVLDEATSSLDAFNEARVQEAIRALHGRVTLLVIAHRLATVREADLIYVLDGGEVVESGTWAELMSRGSGTLRELAVAQGLGAAATSPSMASAASSRASNPDG